MIDIRREQMFPSNVFVMDHCDTGLHLPIDKKEIFRQYRKKLKRCKGKHKKYKKYNHYVFYAATDGWVDFFDEFLDNNDIVPLILFTGNLEVRSKHKWNYFPHWQAVTDGGDSPSPTKKAVPAYRWQMWVRRPREHRISLLKNIAKMDIPNGEIIFPSELYEPGSGRKWPSTKQLFNNDGLYDSISKQFQPAIDIPQGENGAYVASYDIRRNRAIDIITETMVNRENGIFISEKTYKAIRAGQIPLILGQCGTVKALRNQGFNMFDDYVNHSYDNEENFDTRCQMLVDELYRLSTLPKKEFETLWKSTYMQRLENQRHINFSLDYWKEYLNSFFV